MQGKYPDVSVVIANFNSSKTIIDTLNTLVNQSYKNFEIIFCDDNSTDNSLDLAFDYAKKNKLDFKVFKTQSQSGKASVPKNLGIQNSQGYYLAFLDSDDGWYKDKLMLSLSALNNGADIVYHDLDIKYSINNKRIPFNKKKTLETREFYSKNRRFLLDFGNCIVSSSVVLKREIFDKCGLLDTSGPPEDLDMWIRIEEKGYKFKRIEGSHGYYMIHDNNISTSKRSIERYHALLKKYDNYFLNRNLPLWICLSLSRCYYNNELYLESLLFSLRGLKSMEINLKKNFFLIKYLVQSYMYLNFNFIMKRLVKLKQKLIKFIFN